MMEILSIPVIAAIVAAVFEPLSLKLKKHEIFVALIPIFAGIFGGLLGLAAFYAFPTFVPTENIFYSIILGIYSGLSATGSNELVKKLQGIIPLNKKLLKQVNENKSEENISEEGSQADNIVAENIAEENTAAENSKAENTTKENNAETKK